MTIATFLIGISLGLDLFAGGMAVGVAGLPRWRWPRTALLFALFGVILLAIGLVVGELLSDGLGNLASYLAGIALIALGARAIYAAVQHVEDDEPLEETPIDPKSVATTGFVASLDKLAVGISLSLIDISKPWVLLYFFIQGFILTLLGIFLGKRLGANLGMVAHLLAGGVFVLLGVIIIIQTARKHALP